MLLIRTGLPRDQYLDSIDIDLNVQKLVNKITHPVEEERTNPPTFTSPNTLLPQPTLPKLLPHLLPPILERLITVNHLTFRKDQSQLLASHLPLRREHEAMHDIRLLGQHTFDGPVRVPVPRCSENFVGGSKTVSHEFLKKIRVLRMVRFPDVGKIGGAVHS